MMMKIGSLVVITMVGYALCLLYDLFGEGVIFQA
jgi:hypothetical protein